MSFATEMVAKLETLLLANPGASSVNVDGQAVTFTDLNAQWQFWKQVAARESGSARASAQIKLGS